MEILSGNVMVYYCFDVGEEIDITALEALFGRKGEKSPLVCRRLAPAYIQYKTPPFFAREGERALRIGGREYPATFDVKFYGFGVVTVRITLPLTGRLEDVAALSAGIEGNREIREAAVLKLESTLQRMGTAVRRPKVNPQDEWEDYCVYLVDRFDRETSAADIVARHENEIARILRSEERMSAGEKEDALKYRLSYYGDDLTLIDWNASFIYDPSNSYDVPDVIEFAVIQLLELRLYDSLLDAELDRAYDDFAINRARRFRPVALASTISRLSEIRLDMSETIDRLENYLKLIGDLYLAKVYGAASARLYLDRWKSAIRDKLALMESLYAKAWEHSQTTRMVVSEIAIVILFIIDVVLIFLELLK